jgi:hypothetical protein
MIVLGLLVREHLHPPKKLDRIDHLCLWVVKIALVVLFVTLPNVASAAAEEAPAQDFFFHCSNGGLEEVKESLDMHPGM